MYLWSERIGVRRAGRGLLRHAKTQCDAPSRGSMLKDLSMMRRRISTLSDDTLLSYAHDWLCCEPMSMSMFTMFM